MCQILVLRENVLWVWTSCSHAKPAKPVQFCRSLTWHIQTLVALGGKRFWYALAPVPKTWDLWAGPWGKNWDWLRALVQLSPHGAHPSFLTSQLTAKRTKMYGIWDLVISSGISWNEGLAAPSNYPGHCEKHTLWVPFKLSGAQALCFSIVLRGMLLISQVEESLIQSSRITVTFYRKKNPQNKNKSSLRKWLKTELGQLTEPS